MAMQVDLEPPFSREHPKVLLVEGVDEVYLLLQLLREPEFDGHSIDVRCYRGASNLGSALKGLRVASGFSENVETLAVWRDADQDPAGALQSVKSQLEKASFAAPAHSGEFTEGTPRIGVLILPDGRSVGALETLCLASVTDTAPLSCVDSYVNCLHTANVTLHCNSDKVRLYAYLASRKKPGLKLGEAAKAGCWDFSHKAWDPVKKFLHQM